VRLSFDWLSDFVDLSGLSPEDVAEKLTMGAFEVEEIRKVGADIEGPLIVGEIVQINPHPNADKIRLTKIMVSPQGDSLEIVCGADNIIVGQRVPVALPGARVVNRHDGTELRIAERSVRGVTSHGMLCSPPELGITAADNEGILILSDMPELGSDARLLLKLYPDWILHVEPRSNRGDALSVLGLAREVAALVGRPLKAPHWRLPPEEITSMDVPVEIADLEDCPFFSIRVLEGLRVGPSPLRITRRLEAIGVRPVSNVVDITNYVLHELGQPLHAYDLGAIKGPLLRVRRARDGEKLVSIDGKERELNEEVLAIADTAGVVGLAGVMGGKGSEVTSQTAFVALEAAAFSPHQVRRGSRVVGLSSDSSLRFERGVDVSNVLAASDRACSLILECCGGFLGKLTTAGSDKVKPLLVPLRLNQLPRLLEVELSARQVTELLTPLGFAAQTAGEDKVEVLIPSFRQRDVTREIDLVEEVCRLWGYDRIPPSMPARTVAPELPDGTAARARAALSACGLSETWTSSLVAPDARSSSADETVVRVLNPLSDDHQVLRQSLLPGLFRAAAYNQDRGRKDIWLFEIGRVYKRGGAKSSARVPGAVEETRVAGVIAGERARALWTGRSSPEADNPAPGFYRAKGVVEALLESFKYGLDTIGFEPHPQGPHWFHPGRTSRVFVAKDGGIALGWLGEIHPAAAQAAGVRDTIYLFELDLDAIKAHAGPPGFKDIYATPAVSRDLTVDVSDDTEQAAAYRVVRDAAGSHLISLELVSVFPLQDGRKSLSYRLTFQHPEHTLTAEEVDKQLQSVREALKRELSASFRL